MRTTATMEAQTDRPCPDCGIGLFQAPAGEIHVWGCGRCGGQWLDNEGCRQLVSGNLSPRARELATQASHRGRARGADDDEGSYRTAAAAARDARACPFCRHVLTPHVTASGVELDVCAAHGTWFDPFELLKIAHQIDLDLGARIAAAFEARDRRVDALMAKDHAEAVSAFVHRLLVRRR
jgi:Zn-finger nucleic acid-binding protein